jgi:hypothetical protein
MTPLPRESALSDILVLRSWFSRLEVDGESGSQPQSPCREKRLDPVKTVLVEWTRTSPESCATIHSSQLISSLFKHRIVSLLLACLCS